MIDLATKIMKNLIIVDSETGENINVNFPADSIIDKSGKTLQEHIDDLTIHGGGEGGGLSENQVNTLIDTKIEPINTKISDVENTLNTFLIDETANEKIDTLKELLNELNEKANITQILDKVDKSDIISNLTTNDNTKVLASSQGYLLNENITNLTNLKSNIVLSEIPTVRPNDLAKNGLIWITKI